MTEAKKTRFALPNVFVYTERKLVAPEVPEFLSDFCPEQMNLAGFCQAKRQ